MMRNCRLAPIGVLVSAVAATTVVTAAPAQATSGYTVPIPLHPVPGALHLAGASESGVAVQQSDVSSQFGHHRPVFTGPLGSELTLRPAVGSGLNSFTPPTLLTVSGDSLAWYENVWQVGRQPKAPHVLNILTGKDRAEAGQITEPGAFNGDSWFSDRPAGYANPPHLWQYPLRRHHSGTKTDQGMQTDIVTPHVPEVAGGLSMAADSKAVLRATSKGGKHALDLITLGSNAVSRVVENADEILGVALSDDLVVWSTQKSDGSLYVHHRPRAGGKTTTYAEPSPHADVRRLAVGKGGIGYLIHHPQNPDGPVTTTTTLAVVNGTAAKYRDLPYDASGLAAQDDYFLTASSGVLGLPAVGVIPTNRPASGEQGVYRVTADEFTRVATVPAAHLSAAQLTLSAGQMRYVEASRPQGSYQPIYERSVAGSKRAKFSSERALPETSGPISFSAARGAFAVPGRPGLWQFTDRGQKVGTAEAAGTPNVSGSYTLIGGSVFRPDGELVQAVPEAVAGDLFGSKFAYLRAAADGSWKVWLEDVEKKVPLELGTLPSCDKGSPQVSVWGELVAWASACSKEIQLRNLRTGKTRAIPAAGVAELGRLQLSEGTLTWSDVAGPKVAWVQDLTIPFNAPVRLEGHSPVLAIDDHLVARVVESAPSWSLAPRAEMSPLPFTPKYSPRLISTLSPQGFSPNADGRGDTWKPQFDITKPMRKVTLKIQDPTGTKTVAQLDGTAPDGSVRDISWNGLSNRGKQLPSGYYKWTLSGRSDDGEGTLVAGDGTSTVTGVIELGLR